MNTSQEITKKIERLEKLKAGKIDSTFNFTANDELKLNNLYKQLETVKSLETNNGKIVFGKRYIKKGNYKVDGISYSLNHGIISITSNGYGQLRYIFPVVDNSRPDIDYHESPRTFLAEGDEHYENALKTIRKNFPRS